MDILKDIEKNILNINIYEKNIYSDKKDVLNKSNILKLDIIKKQIDDYFKHKVDENNIITQKKLKYEEKYKSARELNNYNYTAYLDKKNELHNIFKETKTLDSLYEYLKYKHTDYKNIPDIYTYEYINLEERVVLPHNNDINTNVCPPGKILNPKTKKCVKDPANKVKAKVDKKKVVVKDDKEKECPEGKILNPKTNRCIKDVNYKPK